MLYEHMNQNPTTTATLTPASIRPVSVDDVIEHTLHGERVSSLVLLVSECGEIIVLDQCDGSTPSVVRVDELVEPRAYIGD